MTYDNLTQCLACGGRELKQYLDLGRQVFANTYPEKYRVDSVLPSAPLRLNLCIECFHSQLSVIADPVELFSDYLYVSSTTSTLKDHFRSLVNQSLPMKRLSEVSVLDIGANDYSLLKEFKSRGVMVEGVDPAANLAEQAGDIPALVDFWGKDTWLKLKQAPYDLITGLNVFAHNKNPLEFLLACKQVLKKDGKILLEFPWLRETIARNSLGQCYHEHISYFTVGSMQTLVERAGLRIADIILFEDIHDGTLRFILDRELAPPSDKVRYFRLIELLAGFYEVQTYVDFGTQVKANIKQLEALLSDLSRESKVVCYGASAKLSTVLGCFKEPPSTMIECIVDDNLLKVGRLQTSTEIRIYSPEELKKFSTPLTIVITPDNFFREIKSRLTKMGIHGQLVRYCPVVSVEGI